MVENKNISVKDVQYPKHLVFLTLEGTLVSLTILNDKIIVLGNSIEPKELSCVHSFEADSHSDFNWGMVSAVLLNKVKSLLKKARDIADNGL